MTTTETLTPSAGLVDDADDAHCRLMTDTTICAPDGTALHTDVVLPAGAGRHPAVLVRTPYGSAAHLAEAFGWARRGIAVVVQDVRGRYRSGGTWNPWGGHEGADGAATVRWVTGQPWSDGRVVAYGSSYAAYCALEIAGVLGNRLAGVVATVPALSAAHTVTEPTGVPRLLAHAWFWPTHGDTTMSRGPVLDSLTAVDPTLLRHLPVAGLPRRLGVPLPSWEALWRRPRPVVPPLGTAPLLVVGGLHDVYAGDAVDLWRRWPGGAARLVLGSWQHDLGLVHRDRNGDRDREPGHRTPVAQFVAGWVAALLDGRVQPGRVWVSAVEGSNRWWVGDDRGPGGQRATVALHPADGRRDFVADPLDPHPSSLGPVDVAGPLRRDDVTVWSSAPASGDEILLGQPVLKLSGLGVPDVPVGTPVDWMVRLAVVDADGGALQVAHAAGRTAETSLTLTLPPVSLRLPAGHRLVVGVSGHLFPVFPRDPQDGADPLTATRLYRARRVVGGARLTLGIPSSTDRHVAGLAAPAVLW